MKPHLLRRALCTAHPSPSEGADWGPYRSPSLRAFICFPTRQANSGPVLAPGRKLSARPPSHTSMLSGCPYRSRILSAMLPLAVAAPRSARVSSLDKPQNCRHSLYPGGEGQDCLSPGSGCPPPACQLGLWPQGPSDSGPWRPHAQQTWRWTASLGGGGSRSLTTDQRGVLPCCSLLAWAVPPGGLSLGPAPRLGSALGHAFWAAGIPAVCHRCLADSCLCPTRRSSLSPATGRLDQRQPGGSGVVPTGPMDGQRGSGGGGHCILGPDMLLCVRETASLP